MILGYHVIISAYGFWLPNDPRGSWSEFVGAWELFRFGSATKTTERHSVARRPHNRALRLAAKEALARPAVKFNGLQARAIGTGFANHVHRAGFANHVHRAGATVWACAILPDHVHLVLARHEFKVEYVANLLKGAATRELLNQQLHPFGDVQGPDGKVPKCWGRGLWKVYLDSEEDLQRAIRYVENNPIKEGKPSQRWSFVTPLELPSADVKSESDAQPRPGV